MNKPFAADQALSAHGCGCGHAAAGGAHQHANQSEEDGCCGGTGGAASSAQEHGDCCHDSADTGNTSKTRSDQPLPREPADG